ncbi:MAG TPA: Nramp family divalent metal transporter [Chloroflexota bacterium]
MTAEPRGGTGAEEVRAALRRTGVWRTRGRLAGWLALLSLVGPGLIAANAGNDAGGIATYASVGARYGYSLLWAMLLLTLALAVVQEMCARMGVATGEGLTDLVRAHLGIRWTLLVVLCLLIANGGTIVSEFAGVGAAAELFGVPRYLAIPPAAVAVWWLVVRGSYPRVERALLAMTLVFFAYPISAYLARPDWGEVARQTGLPTIRLDGGYLFILVALIGTTITPYMQLYVQSSVADKGVSMAEYAVTRLETYAGALFSNLVSAFIIIATAATLYVSGITNVDSAEDAARALEPLAGRYASGLFAVGLLGASLLAAAVLPLATAYAVAEALGFEKGVDRGFREAPVFLGLYSGLVVLGALIALVPGLPLITLLLVVQVVNGLLLPVVLVSILRLVNRRDLMGPAVNGPITNVLAYALTIAVSGCALAMVVGLLLG